jgi:hypothetical protein
MSMILYYSNYCENCSQLLQRIASWPSVKDDMHFINIDRRIKKPNGVTYIVLSNGQELLLPPNVSKVPALMLLNKGQRVLFGPDITKHLEPQQVAVANIATEHNGEPMCFSMGGGSGFGCGGVTSDCYSFLDQDATDLSAKGNGGLRQQHHYATINFTSDIQTPPETYTPDKIGTVSMEQLNQKRDMDVGRKS